jgi:hypothetical protein
MSLKTWDVKKVTRKEITSFIEKWHYSKSINGCISDYCYALFDDNDEMKGALFFGRMASKQYHDKSIRTKYKGVLKPFARRIKKALDNGEAFYKTTLGKYTYIYQL